MEQGVSERFGPGGGNSVKNYGLDGQEHLRPVRRRRGRCGACPGGNRDLSFDQGCDGVRGSALVCRGRGNNNPLVATGNEPDYVHMDGQEVYKFAVTTVPVSIHKALEQAGLQAEDIKYFFPAPGESADYPVRSEKTSYFCG